MWKSEGRAPSLPSSHCICYSALALRGWGDTTRELILRFLVRTVLDMTFCMNYLFMYCSELMRTALATVWVPYLRANHEENIYKKR
jgi:hypothetical protein